MNGNAESAQSLIADIVAGISQNQTILDSCDILVCPSSLFLAQSINKGLSIGAQDCSAHESGAYTGDLSATMLKDIGCGHVILGHSERRQYHNESNALITKKAEAAHNAGLITIICVGETEDEREAGIEGEIVGRQISESIPETATPKNTVIAYEPVWAIGTGKTASADDAQKMHSFIRRKTQEKLADGEKLRILYGGSMKPDNAGKLLAMPDVDGGLIGGASLIADKFLAIALAAPKL